MPGIFIIKGMDIRIPAGGLTISIDGPSSVLMETRLDVYPALLQTAIDHVTLASDANKRLLAAATSDDEEGKAEALIQELKDVLVSIVTSAAALDAFHSRVSDVAGLPEDLRAAWKKNRTKRASRIAETLKLAVDLPGKRWQQVESEVRELFKFRDWAMHPQSEYATPVNHPDLGAAVDPSLLKFRYANGKAATLIALRTVSLCVANPKQNDAVKSWATAASQFIDPIVKTWEGIYGPMWGAANQE